MSFDASNIHPFAAGDPPEDYLAMVLLVDDQLLVGESVRIMLDSQPHMEFHYCPDAVDALRTAKEVRPTVILQDLVMPGVNGLDLVRQYRADPATSSIPIIVLSSKEEASVKNEAFKAGANDYLVKLPHEVELIARINYHSKSYLNQLQRDDAYRALRESQRQLLEMNFQLQRLTNLDGLTGLSNRRHFDQHMEAEWKRAIRSQTSISILMLDVDHFKSYNDTNGHLAGDEVLKTIATTIQQTCLRSSGTAARFGGEEFALILTATDLSESERVGERLRRNVEALQIPHGGSGTSPFVTVSLGGASTIPQEGDAFLRLVDAADKALYRAKEAGRNRLVFSEPE